MANERIITIDFDGTLYETEYPRILRPIFPVIEAAKAERERGAKLILWTCREGDALDQAVEACREYGLEFDAVNDNLPEMKAEWGNNPRKVAATEYWDDRNGPVRRGTWIGKHGYAQCSVCGVWQSNIYDFENWQRYCGHCGAEMTNLRAASRKNDPLQDKILWRLLNMAARRIARKYRGMELSSHVDVKGIRYVYEIRVAEGR